MRSSSKRAFTAALLAGCAAILGGASGAAAMEPLEVVHVDEGSFVSGGVGEAERAQMLESARDYDLMVTFAQKSDGAYLSGVEVSVKRQLSGEAPLELVTSGPILLAELPPGDYSISIRAAGWRPEQRVVSVGTGPLQVVHVALEPEAQP